MKDLDFDELDRAVNSLMTNVPDSDAPKPEEAEKTLEITPTLDDSNVASPLSVPTVPTDAKPAERPGEPVVSPTPTPLATPSPRPSVATRRGGRFMDVVHPSSDMKSSDMKKPTIPARSPVSRQGVTIAAPSSIASKPVKEEPAAPDEPQLSATEVEPATTTPEPSFSAPAHEQPAPANEWPDPLEMADFKDDPEKHDDDASTEPKASQPNEVTPPEEEPQEEAVPLTSPFLSGTKVEKRPLGGSTEPADEPDRAPAFGAKADSDLAIADPNAQLPPAPTDIEPELPEELKGDLVAIEADTTVHHKEEKPEETTETPDSDTLKAEKSEPAPEQTPKGTPAPMIVPPSDEKLLTAGPTSIPQQYREEPNTGDQDNGAIYDTDTYHQPLAHPAKKKPSWLWIVWIVLILAVGAGAGAALYLLGIM